MESLEVYLNERKVGRLDDDNGSLSFAYDTVYLSSGIHEPLSHALPLRVEPYAHREVEPVLSNLLPDDVIRTRLGEILQIPRENTFALLKALGGDCAGAVSFFPPEISPTAASDGEFRELSDDEAGAILDNLEKRPLDVGEAGFRISGAGAQDKLIACVRSGQVLLPLNGTPSTHIIKTEIRNYPGSVENEWYSMSLASACGLSVAASEIAEIGGRRRFVSTRYDRALLDGRVVRLHQEDFCQMLGIDPRRKYEALGGPGIVTSFRLLRELPVSAADALEFIDRVIFNFLVGNGDAHGKNFSVLYRDGVASLAPMYDVMCTTVYPDVGRRMAMKIDDEYAFKWITSGKFTRMAVKIGVSEKIMLREVSKMSRRVRREADSVASRCNRVWPSCVYASIAAGIAHRLDQIQDRREHAGD
ncbi:MAG: type II toxin-antitoxin system HipA family toxin [Kiritimatiellae bacterium]|nr:type II toxin-antitoxin system HipA family toxin [Kiritimatiellia bacterium]